MLWLLTAAKHTGQSFNSHKTYKHVCFYKNIYTYIYIHTNIQYTILYHIVTSPYTVFLKSGQVGKMELAHMWAGHSDGIWRWYIVGSIACSTNSSHCLLMWVESSPHAYRHTYTCTSVCLSVSLCLSV